MDAEQEQNVAIFWDYENCEVPAATDGYAIANGIRRIAHEYGGVKVFRAYCDTPDALTQRSALVRADLHACGVSVIDCPHNGRKDTADKKMMVDMLAHAIDNPAPATIILISGDGDFVYAVSTLRLRKYKVILLAPTQCAHWGLKAQANEVYEWPRDVLSTEPPVATVVSSPGSTQPSPITLKHARSLSSSGIRPDLPHSLSDINNRPNHTVVGGGSKALSSPNTPQIAGYLRLPAAPTGNVRTRSNSVHHARSTSMPAAQVSTTYAHAIATPRMQPNAVLPDLPQMLSSSDQLTQTPQEAPSPWRLPKPLSSIPSAPTHSGSLSPLVPAINVDGPHDLPSHEERSEDEHDGRDGDVSASQTESTAYAADSGDASEAAAEASTHPSTAATGTYQLDDQLPSPLEYEEASTRSEANENYALSEETTQTATADAEAGEAAESNLISVLVHPDIVVPDVIMTRLRRPPYAFKALINVLERERLRGNTRVVFSQLGSLLRQEDHRAFSKAGPEIKQLKDYIAKAEQAQVVIVGSCYGPNGLNGNRWTALHPFYHGRPEEQVPPAQTLTWVTPASGAM